MTGRIQVATLRPRLRTISDEQILEIHNASLDILSQTGIVMQSEKARSILLEAGAWEAGDRLKVPPHLVTDAIASAPSRIPMCNRLGEMVMPLETGKVFFGSGSDCVFTVDMETGERRVTTSEDTERIARLCDGLDNIDFVMSMTTPSDVPAGDTHVQGFVGMIRGSVKPNVYTAKDRGDMEDIYSIACAVAGSEERLRERPFLLLYAQPISPLLFPDESIEKLLFCAEKGIPACYPPSTNTGGGGPITMAGALALGNAECLVGLVLTQLVRRGSPYVYGLNASTMDMKSTIVSYGSPEWSLSMAASTDIAEHYGLPSWGYAGATDSKTVDAQAGIDATYSIMIALLVRCNLVHDVGYIEYGNTSSMEMLVIADDIIDEVRFLLDGVPVNEVTLARDAIDRARPGGGFLADDHTLENWRWAQWQPRVLDRRRYEEWIERGSKDLPTHANERARQILEDREVTPLPEAAEEEIARILSQRQEAGG